MKTLIEKLQEKFSTKTEKETIKHLCYLYLKENKPFFQLIEEIVSSSVPASERPEKLRDVIVFPPSVENAEKEKEEEEK
jgi:hypothetical protein